MIPVGMTPAEILREVIRQEAEIPKNRERRQSILETEMCLWHQ